MRPDICRGCPFLLTIGELPDATSAAHHHAVAAKAWVRAAFRRLVADLEAAEPEALADALCLVLDGTYGSVETLGTDGPAAQSERVVRTLLASPAEGVAVGTVGARRRAGPWALATPDPRQQEVVLAVDPGHVGVAGARGGTHAGHSVDPVEIGLSALRSARSRHSPR